MTKITKQKSLKLLPLFETNFNNQKKTIIYDTVMAVVSFPIAVILYFQSLDLSYLIEAPYPRLIATIFLIKFAVFFFFRLSRGMWIFFSTPDFIKIIQAISLASILSASPILFGDLDKSIYSMLFLDWFICGILLCGGRAVYKILKEPKKQGVALKRALIIGAGEAGDQLVRELSRNPNSGFKVLGFLDDDPSVLNRTVHGIRVFGTLTDLDRIIKLTKAESILIAIPSASPSRIKSIAKECLKQNLEVKTLPTLRDLVDGKVQVTSLKSVNIEDLLGREPIRLDEVKLGNMIRDKVIFVTGGGGSIGSELCKQILRFEPKKLVIFEVCEFFIYQTEQMLKETFPEVEIIATVGDVRDRERVALSLETHMPDIIFHAAAYKHVPMMEHNPGEAIKTNVLGTKIVSEEVARLKLGKFVLISTDKAVNPTNIMGATKRVAEMICEDQNSKSSTDYIVLRFGNVLGSAGSVIPHFLKQIREGKAIKITHPEITRYFMSIPEATQLVLQAGSLGKGGEIFVLDMGEPVKILDLANDLIRLSGLVPDQDIAIEYSGLRPGEKLYEELLASNEDTLATDHEMVRVAKVREVSSDLNQKVAKLIEGKSKESEIRRLLKDLVPEYCYDQDQSKKTPPIETKTSINRVSRDRNPAEL